MGWPRCIIRPLASSGVFPGHGLAQRVPWLWAGSGVSPGRGPAQVCPWAVGWLMEDGLELCQEAQLLGLTST